MNDRFWRLRVAGCVTLLALAPGLAWSYIDAGNGAYVVQLLFTLAGAASFYIRHPLRFLRAVRNWISRRKSSDANEQGAAVREVAELKDAADISVAGPE
jgi:hypothetical protein